MNRSWIIAALATVTAALPAQNSEDPEREKVLGTVQRLEERLERFDRLLKNLQDQRGKNQDPKDDLAQLTKQIAELRTALTARDQEVSKLQQVEKQTLAQAAQARDRAEKQLLTLHTREQEQKALMDKLAKEKSQIDAERKEMKAHADKLAAEFKNVQQERERVAKELVSTKDTVQSERAKLADQLADRDRLLVDLKKNLDRSQGELTALQQKSGKQNEQAKQEQAAVQKLQAELQRQSAEGAELKKALLAAQQEAKARLASEADFKKKLAQQDEVSKKLQATANDAAQLRDEAAGLRKELEHQRTEARAQSDKEVANLRSQNQAGNAKLETAGRQTAELREENAGLRKELERVRAKNHELADALEHHESAPPAPRGDGGSAGIVINNANGVVNIHIGGGQPAPVRVQEPAPRARDARTDAAPDRAPRDARPDRAPATRPDAAPGRAPGTGRPDQIKDAPLPKEVG